MKPELCPTEMVFSSGSAAKHLINPADPKINIFLLDKLQILQNIFF